MEWTHLRLEVTVATYREALTLSSGARVFSPLPSEESSFRSGSGRKKRQLEGHGDNSLLLQVQQRSVASVVLTSQNDHEEENDVGFNTQPTLEQQIDRLPLSDEVVDEALSLLNSPSGARQGMCDEAETTSFGYLKGCETEEVPKGLTNRKMPRGLFGYFVYLYYFLLAKVLRVEEVKTYKTLVTHLSDKFSTNQSKNRHL